MKKIKLYYVRGGTSSGVIIQKKDLPEDRESIERIAREIFGVPRSSCQPPDEYQIEGIGKGKSTSNKLFIIDVNIEDKMVCSTFIQLENISSRVSWDVNCGNMTTAIPLVLDDLGLMDVINHNEKITIHNTNTNKIIYCSLPKNGGENKLCKIPGVYHRYPEIDISFKNPEASTTNALFPTGKKIDNINGKSITCIDAVIPMVIMRAEDFGLSGMESKTEMSEKHRVLNEIEEIRVKAGVLMGIKNKSGANMTEDEIRESITVPKISLISQGGDGYDISAFYLTPKEIHNSIAVSGGACLSYACYISNTVASQIYCNADVRVKHFSGVSEFGVVDSDGEIEIYTKRNAQIYISGDFYLYDT